MLIVLVSVTTNSHAHTHAPKHAHPHADVLDPVTRIQRLAWFLEEHFDSVELHMPEEMDEAESSEDAREPSLLVQIYEAEAVINLKTLVSGV